MLAIRLARIGKKKYPRYRIIVSDKSKDTHGDFLEIVGYFHPQSNVCDIKKDRVVYWISQGAQPSPTVHNLFIDKNIISGKKVKASKSKKKENAKSASETKEPSAKAPAS